MFTTDLLAATSMKESKNRIAEDRICLTVDLYSKTTDNLLLTPAYTTGLDNGFKNVGKMGNKGLEITINTVNIRTQNFT